MKNIFLLFILMSLMLSLSALPEEKINAREYIYQTFTQDGFTLQWRSTTDSYLDVIVSAQTTGWVAVGFGATNAMANANIVIGYVSDSNVFIRDDFGVTQTSHASDVSLGGVDNLLNKNGTEENGVTTLMFRIPLDSNDQYDKLLTPNQAISIIMAKGGNNSDNFTSMHNSAIMGEIVIPEVPIAYNLVIASVVWNLNNEAMISWETTDEMNLTGYNVYRSSENSFPSAFLVNQTIIPANNTSPSSYSFTNTGVQQTQSYYYWIEGVELDGNSHVSEALFLQALNNDEIVNDPISVMPLQNYPNPFNPSTRISFELVKDDFVHLLIYNTKGQLVRTLYEGFKQKGIHGDILWDGKNNGNEAVSSGMYYLVLKSSYTNGGKKLILLK